MPVAVTKHKIVAFVTITVLQTGIFSFLFAQKNSSTVTAGTIKGTIQDSTYGYMLTSATLAVYRASDSSLLQFTIPNNLGEFVLKKLPLSEKLTIVATHVGFLPFRRFITLNKDSATMDVGILYMHQDYNDTAIGNVVIKSSSPIRMNGDTLEFNANAFKMNADASAEDLLRKLPGFTIWGDGSITFNGKPINTILVGGKPFFGGKEITIATQNLPKEALDKIQVYQKKDDKNPLDSTLFANLKLKEDYNAGHFGKLSTSGGSNKRYALDGVLSAFNSRMQTSLASSNNNVNKVASSTDLLITNGNYKGERLSVDYHTDFSLPGITQSNVLGGKFQYNFTPYPSDDKNARLNADVLSMHKKIVQQSETLSQTVLTNDTLLKIASNNNHTDDKNNKSITTQFEKTTHTTEYKIGASIESVHTSAESNASSSQSNSVSGLLSNNTMLDSAGGESKKIQFNATYRVRDKSNTQYEAEKAFSRLGLIVDYQLQWQDGREVRKRISDFTSVPDVLKNVYYNRLYVNNNLHGIDQSVAVSIPGLSDFAGGKDQLGGIKIGVSNQLFTTQQQTYDQVRDWQPIQHDYLLNNYLSGKRQLSILDERPSLILSRLYNYGLTNRFLRQWNVKMTFTEQFYHFDHQSSQAFQNIRYNIQKFIPQLSAIYQKHVYGSYVLFMNVSGERKYQYPNIFQLAPLADSSNNLYLLQPNLILLPERNDNLYFNFDYTLRKNKNPASIHLQSNYSFKKNIISDSVVYNTSGQQALYRINMPQGSDFSFSILARKAIENKHNSIQLDARYAYEIRNTSGYINGYINQSATEFHRLFFIIHYNHKQWLNLQLEQFFEINTSRQEGLNNLLFKTNNRHTTCKSSIQLINNLVWNNYVLFNNSRFTSNTGVSYTIWNTTIGYRFLPGKKAEISFSALDLLRQNKSIINTAIGNTQTLIYNSVLQQYFMCTLSYYPRKFGK